MAKERVIERPNLDEMVGAIHVLADEGSPTSLQTLCLLDRLLRVQLGNGKAYQIVEDAVTEAEMIWELQTDTTPLL